MVEHYQEREIAPSKQQITTSSRSFGFTPIEFQTLRETHQLLFRALDNVHRYVYSSDSYGHGGTAQMIRQSILQYAPSLEYGGRSPSFVTTEVVLDTNRQPYIVGINAHSARHWDVLAGIGRTIHASITSTPRLIQTIRERLQGQEIVIIGDVNQPRYSNLAKALVRYGLNIRYQSLDETEQRLTKDWQLILELPMMQGRKQKCRAIHHGASFAIEPFSHLSGQFVLSFLSNADANVAISDILQQRILDLDSLFALQRRIPKTFSLASSSIPPNALIKSALPLSTQRKICRLNSDMDLESRLYSYVAQERLDQLSIELPNERQQCPIRFYFVSYRGELVTGMAIAHVPANGHPSKDVALDLVIR